MPEEDGTPPEFKAITSQEELDRRVGDRLARERAKFADYDDMKKKAERLDEVEAASKTELQKALDAVAERDAKLAELPKQIRGQVVRFASLATQRGFIDPEDALSFLDNGVDLGDDAAVGTALDALAERKPHLVRTPATKVKERPKPKTGDANNEGDDGEEKGKERAAAALRQFRSTR